MPMMIPARVPSRVGCGDCDKSVYRQAPSPKAFANPKSRTLTLPSGVTLMLAGFRSRWMMPFSCAASRASAICLKRGSASSTGIRPAGDPLRQRLSSARAPSPGTGCLRLLESVIVAMLGWFKRSKKPCFALEASQAFSVFAKASGRTLIATSRLELGVPSAVDLAHAAGADRRENLVGTEWRALIQRHRQLFVSFGDR